MSDFFSVDISLGSVSACEGTVSDAVARPVAEARKYVEAASVVHVDETGYRQAFQADQTAPPGKAPTKPKAWLWVAVTTYVTTFLVHARRSTAAAKELLGSFPGASAPDVGPARCAGAGILVSDRWSAYSFIDAARRQLCWAHLLRDFEWIAEFGAEALGKALVEETKRMFRWWHTLRAGVLPRSGFQERMRPLAARVEALLEEGAACDHKKTAGKCRRMLGLKGAFWTFVRIEGVEPTNNAAERALRPAVLWRKGSFGSASERGSRFAERIMTVATTCRQQGRSVLEYLVAACEAHARAEPAPSLLPAGALSAAA
jgi:transposase